MIIAVQQAVSLSACITMLAPGRSRQCVSPDGCNESFPLGPVLVSHEDLGLGAVVPRIVYQARNDLVRVVLHVSIRPGARRDDVRRHTAQLCSHLLLQWGLANLRDEQSLILIAQQEYPCVLPWAGPARCLGA